MLLYGKQKMPVGSGLEIVGEDRSYYFRAFGEKSRIGMMQDRRRSPELHRSK